MPRVILVVDDEESSRDINRRWLEQYGFSVILASSGPEALERLTIAPEVAAVVSDMTMPGMTGLELLEEVRKSDPDMPFLFCSGTPALVSDQVQKLGKCRYLGKPYLRDDLLDALRKLLLGSGASRPSATNGATT